MPVYEYICKKCQHKFEAILTLKEHESKQVELPQVQQPENRAGCSGILRGNFAQELKLPPLGSS